MSDHSFQVNLRGVIDLLSEHLYSTPRVYIRELLQNATDAISARQRLGDQPAGTIQLELTERDGDRPPVLVTTDNGIGLTTDEVHRFLATIGESSKRGAARPDDFIGRFGIGLLSGFLVADEIVVITKSARELDAKPVEWRGRSDGTYSVRELDGDFAPGTQVFYTAREDAFEFFTFDAVTDIARHYGRHLPIDISVTSGDAEEVIGEPAPWGFGEVLSADEKEELLAYGQELFGTDFLDVLPLRSDAGGVSGIAFVLPTSTQTPAKQSHHAYLKGMLLSDNLQDILPPWAFFVRCVVNATTLRPTASREAFYENAELAATRDQLGDALRQYLTHIARHDEAMFDRLLHLHALPMKALAVDDDDFYRMIIDWLPFETSVGRMRMRDIVQRDRLVRYSTSNDQFRQVSSVAAAQDVCVVNAGYVYDEELVAKLSQLFPDRRTQPIKMDQLIELLEDLTLDERERVADFLKLAELVLQPYRCEAQVQKFEPSDLPVLYTSNDDANFLRAIDRTRETATDVFADIMDRIAQVPAASARACLTFNHRSTLVRQLAALGERELAALAIEMLYVQSLLLGHHPLGSRETSLLGEGLLGLINIAIDRESDD